MHNFLFVLLSLFCLNFLIGITNAKTYYVSPRGLDSNSGTEASPFKSIQKGADVVNPGDTVIVKDGVYVDTNEDNIVVKISTSGTSKAWITFKSKNKWGAVLDGKNNKTLYGISLISGSSYIHIEGFEIKNMGQDGFYSNTGSSYVNILKNKIHHTGSQRIYEKDICYGMNGAFDGAKSTYHNYDSNILYSNGRLEVKSSTCIDGPTACCHMSHDHGIYTRGQNNTIQNNIFYDHDNGWGIQISPESDTLNIINNTFSDPNPHRLGQIVIWGQYDQGYPDNINIKNNIFNKAKGSSIYCSGAKKSKNIVIENNLTTSENQLMSYSIYCNDFNFTDRENIVSDPAFVNSEDNNYNLKSFSPAINNGLLTGAPLLDIAGKKRTGLPDLGAYEFNKAKRYYVSPNGLDSNPGTEVSPFKSIQKGADVVKPGDTVIIKDGIYTDSNKDKYVLYIKKGGISERWVTFKAENKGKAILDGLNKSTFGVIAGKDIGYVSIDGLEIKNNRNTGIFFSNNWAADHWKIINNHVHDNGLLTKSTQNEMNTYLYGHAGIYIGRGLENIVIDRNTIHHNGRLADPEKWNSTIGYEQKHEYFHDHGIYIEKFVNNVKVTNNIFYEHQHGYHFKLSPGDSNIIISNNYFYGPNKKLEANPGWGWGGAIDLWHGTSGVSNITLNNNTFFAPTSNYVIWTYGPFSNPNGGDVNIVNFKITNNKTTSQTFLSTTINKGDWKLSNNTTNTDLSSSPCYDCIDSIPVAPKILNIEKF